MRTVFEEDEEVESADLRPDVQEDRELTISATTLLAIFFGLVLICGLFFGLGYTLGRRTQSEASSSQASTAGSSSLPETPIQAKPSAASQTDSSAATDSSPAAAPADTGSPDASSTTPSTSASEETPEQPKAEPPPLEEKAAPSALPSTPPSPQLVKTAVAPSAPASAPSAAPGAGIMVQIAAISNPADADVLAKALEKHGYTVTARHLPSDSLIHVQVGPFTSRADAFAMRQKLLSDGYNAILK